MAGNLSGYRADDWEPAGDFSPLPAGEYVAAIVESEMRDTKAGDGKYLYLELEVIEGDYQGRKLFDRLNLDNPSPQAEEIAKRQLSSICRATGRMTPEDSCELHNIPLRVRVAVEARSDNGEPANRVKSYKPASRDGNGGEAVEETPKPPANPAPQATKGTAGKKAPWTR